MPLWWVGRVGRPDAFIGTLHRSRVGGWVTNPPPPPPSRVAGTNNKSRTALPECVSPSPARWFSFPLVWGQ